MNGDSFRLLQQQKKMGSWMGLNMLSVCFLNASINRYIHSNEIHNDR